LKHLKKEEGKHTGIGLNFLNRTPIGQYIREGIDNWDCIKLKRFYAAEGTVTRMNIQLTEWGKIFASHTPDKGLIEFAGSSKN
jgi:hypothetical protein